MVSLARFIVEAHHADIVDHKGQAILEIVVAATKRPRHPPNRALHEHAWAEGLATDLDIYRTHHTPAPSVM